MALDKCARTEQQTLSTNFYQHGDMAVHISTSSDIVTMNQSLKHQHAAQQDTALA